MTQRELIQRVGERLHYVPRGHVEDVVKATFDVMMDSMAKHEEIAIPSFGKFEARSQAARTARNPRTGESVAVPARMAPRFKPSTALKEAVNS